jgi:hypothetical protein
VLPELTAARAAAVSGDARAIERLDEIERRGLFVTALEADERTLVLHDLFREALHDRLQRRWPGRGAGAAAPRRRGERDPVRRVGFLLRAQDWFARRSRAGGGCATTCCCAVACSTAAPDRAVRRRLARRLAAPAAPERMASTAALALGARWPR